MIKTENLNIRMSKELKQKLLDTQAKTLKDTGIKVTLTQVVEMLLNKSIEKK